MAEPVFPPVPAVSTRSARGAPAITGTRLGVVLGSGIAVDALTQSSPGGMLPDAVASASAGGPAAHDIDTPFGPVVVRDIGAAVVVHRHEATNDGHLPAHRIDHHRTVAGLCAAGCDRVLAVASVGGLRAWPVGTLVAPFDFYAPQVNPSFYDDARAHSVPGFDPAWRDRVIAAWNAGGGLDLMDGGVYAQTGGPRFETPAEVRALARDADVVGMTLAAECILAREAGLAYAAVCMVDNLANGLAELPLTMDEFHAGVAANRTRLLADLRTVIGLLAGTTRG